VPTVPWAGEVTGVRRFLAGVVGPLVIVAAWASAALAQQAEYEASVSVRTDDWAAAVEQRLHLPLFLFLEKTAPSAGGHSADLSEAHGVPGAGSVSLRHTLPQGGPSSWGAVVSLTRASFSLNVYLHERHRSSDDPFRLVHGSVHAPTSAAVAAGWDGPVPAVVQYVSAVPLRGASGPLLYGQVQAPFEPAVRLTALAYGTSRLRHEFVALDGEWSAGRWRWRWGAARQTGVEVSGASGFSQVSERAAFVRTETSFGRHRVWLLLHDTSPGFRSLAASDYPFRRGAAAAEGRWQWRPATGRLLSVYAQRRLPVNAPDYAVLEAGFSSMSWGRWGWRVDAETAWVDGAAAEHGVTFTLTNPDRRFEQSLSLTVPAGGVPRRRASMTWDDGAWRVRLSADDRLPGWRLEWRWTPDAPWSAALVVKQRTYSDRGVVSWFHASITRDVPGFGQVWLQWMEPDQGRLDVGWNRPPGWAAGVRVVF